MEANCQAAVEPDKAARYGTFNQKKLQRDVSEKSDLNELLRHGQKSVFGATIDILSAEYGWRFLAFQCVSQHICKGTVNHLSIMPRMFIFKEFHVSAARAAVYGGVIHLPWAMKPALGVLSDTVPILGRSKGPYLIASAILGMISFAAVGFIGPNLSVQAVVILLFLGMLFVSTVDLLSEAAYAVKLKEKPEHGPSLISFVWGGLHAGGFLAIVIGSWFLVNASPFVLYRMAALLSSLVIAPVAMNWLGEKTLTHEEEALKREKVCAQREALWLAVIMLGASLVLAWSGIYFRRDIHTTAYISLAVGAVVLIAFSVMLNPIIAKVNAFSLIHSACAFKLGTASFYFMTDGPVEYPNGPHFSTAFYTLTMPLIAAVFSIVGIWVYSKFGRDLTFQRMFFVGSFLVFFSHLSDLIFYTRLNKRYAIDDHIFVLGSTSLEALIGQCLWMPGVVLMSQLCPNGMEAIMYANLAGCHNIGSSLASNFGALLLRLWSVEPSGSIGDESHFENMWIVSLVCTTAPLLPVVLVPWLIPNKKSTEPLLEDPDAPVGQGSLLHRWTGQCGRWRAVDHVTSV